jgi:hypothetical protein
VDMLDCEVYEHGPVAWSCEALYHRVGRPPHCIGRPAGDDGEAEAALQAAEAVSS